MPETASDVVSAREERLVIPTYRIGKPEKNPMFLEKRAYQGSSGAVYPYPVVERVFSEKSNQAYNAIILENRYLKIVLLPEIGGRVYMALDKTNGYHFVYYNRVIKPALVGLTGPWLSGGIEFNWPQHHRPSTFEPVDFHITANPDGSKTVWLSEIERMFRMKGMAGFTLYPDHAYLEVKVQLYNRTPLPQTFLWWANPAVHVNDDYQSVFPPDVQAVMDHGKRDVSDFPIATGTYYKVNYAPGTDISRYKNIPVPTSYMAHHSDFDFLGCYDHGKRAGLMHVANHHVVPGKKQWTWGNGDFGRAWDHHLTDEDGPYIELMCGAYTDNQPDFSWLMPGEEKRFSQIFMPYKTIGPAKNANRDAVINLEIDGCTARIGVYLTAARRVSVQLLARESCIFEQVELLSPETTLTQEVRLPEGTSPQQVMLRVLDGERELIRFAPLPDEKSAMPSPASAAREPAEIESNEELFLNGLHLEQYRHATCAPEPYYLEALRRDPLDSRCNNAMGLLLLRRGKFAEAETYFRAAIRSLTRRNPNPYDGEPYYNLGLALTMQARYREAFDTIYKAVWNGAWQDSAYFELARLACRDGRYDESFDLLDRALTRNRNHPKARHLQIALRRRLGKTADAGQFIQAALNLDCMDFGALFEHFLLAGDMTYKARMRDQAHNYLELALDYAAAGLYPEAIQVLQQAPQSAPMALYYLGSFYLISGEPERARACWQHAAALPPDYCFPNEIECVPVLQTVMQHRPEDARAPYYLGNFWYAHRRYDEAIAAWERSAALDPAFPTVHRNLGLAYMNKRHDPARALAAYETAFRLDPGDARVCFELDQLYKRLNRPPAERLAWLENYAALVATRDDLIIEQITLLNLLRRHDKALRLLLSHEFHPWEGGEGKASGQYVLSLVELAKAALDHGDPRATIEYLKRAREYPASLGEGKLVVVQDSNILYYLGCAYRALDDEDQAADYFRRAAVGLSEPTSAMYYNDQPPDMIFYQGMAQQALGNQAEAEAIFRKLIEYGERHLDDAVKVDYFAVSLPDFLVFDDDLTHRNRIHCRYMMALGCLGLRQAEAAQHFDTILTMDRSHLGATIHSALVEVDQP